MKIGDRVRFLSDVGGGIVSKFGKGNIVYVEDADGFEIPMPLAECVVIETDDYNIAKVDTIGRKEDKKASKNAASPQKHTYSEEPEEKPITFKPKPEERKDGDKLTVLIAFVPVNIKEISSTRFEAYIVNDCNYYVNYSFMAAENATWSLRSTGVIEPNTKVFLEEFGHQDLNELERIAVQMFAYKEGKPFMMKPAISVDIRVDTTKFYKLHTFKDSLFFDEPALEYYVVKDDVATRPLVVNADELKKAMYEKANADRPHKQPARSDKKAERDAIIEVDLHAAEILDSTAGMSAGDIKEYQMNVFRKTMEEHIKEKGRRIVFIHGKGEGILRSAIISELKHKYKSCTYQDASFQQYGFGATMVVIRG